MGKDLEKCFKDWGLDRMLTITVDNAQSNDVAIGYLKKKQEQSRSCLLGGQCLHMRCVAHILNLIVSDGFNTMDESIERIRNSVRYIRNSNARLAKFMELAKKEGINPKLGLMGDVCTRWNSTYLMLERAITFEKVFQQYDYEDSKFNDDLDGEVPSTNDWEKAKKLCKVFKRFYNLTSKVSGTSYVTSNTMLQDICSILQGLRESEKFPSSDVSGMAEIMKTKFDKYWGSLEKINMLVYISAIMDPRKKLNFVEFCLKKMFPGDNAKVTAMVAKIKEALVELFEEYKRVLQFGNTPQNQVLNQPSTASNVAAGGDGMGLDDDDDVMNEFRVFKMESGKEENLTELDKYLKEDTEGDEFDVLGWWKVNRHRF